MPFVTSRLRWPAIIWRYPWSLLLVEDVSPLLERGLHGCNTVICTAYSMPKYNRPENRVEKETGMLGYPVIYKTLAQAKKSFCQVYM